MKEHINQIDNIPSKDDFRKHFLPYSKKAFKQLPKIKNPRILDVGCGSGVTTIKLAEWIKGEIVGLDIDNKSLKSLKKGYNQRDLVIESKQFGARSWEINLMVFP